MLNAMPYIIVEKCCLSGVREQLLELKLLREGEIIRKLNGDVFAIPVFPSAQSSESNSTPLIVNGKSYHVVEQIDNFRVVTKKPYELMVEAIEKHMKENKLWREELLSEIPRSWVRYGDLILFKSDSFKDPVWKRPGDSLWRAVCKVLKVKRLGRMYTIKPDAFRSPKVEIIYGDYSWVNIVDGHVRYTWDVRFCMFSPGNATERFRVGQMDCQGETVVDMYAGIGYFTIPFLVHAKAKHVLACEWNPHAVAALRQNLCINKVSSQCYIYEGDNKEVCPQNVADRVYLGLIPTCLPGIETACKALKFHSGGVLHLHENVSSWKNPSKNAFSSEALSVVDLQSTPGYSATFVATENETLSAFKNDITKELPCQKCQEIEAKFPDLGDIKNDGSHKFSHTGSFTIKENEGLLDDCPSIDLNWRRKEWFRHAIHLSHTVCSILSCFHKKPWIVSVINMHHVKSYAPHIDHIVYDLKCLPVA